MEERRDWAGWTGIASLLALLVTSPLAAEGWPGWRGPARDGSLGADWQCAAWPTELERRWRIPVGTGHASPVIFDQRVFVLSREGESEVVRAIDMATGDELWSRSYPVDFKSGIGSGKHGKGPRSTPAVAGGRLYTLGASGVLSAWDVASGDLLWRLEAAERFEKGSLPFGNATSPLLDQGKVIVFLGGKRGGALLALDAVTGEQVWAWEAESPSYASPVVVEIEGVRQVVTQSKDSIVSVEAGSGQLLWRLPFASSMSSHNVVTPLPLEDGALVLSGRKRGLWAVRPALEGDSWRAEELWRTDELSTELSSPVAESGRVFGLDPSRKGRFFALDAETGERIWTSGGRDAESAALVTAPGVVLALTVEGELRVLDATTSKMEALASYRVSDEGWSWAHPAIVGDRIVIKDRNTLALWALDCGS